MIHPVGYQGRVSWIPESRHAGRVPRGEFREASSPLARFGSEVAGGGYDFRPPLNTSKITMIFGIFDPFHNKSNLLEI